MFQPISQHHQAKSRHVQRELGKKIFISIKNKWELHCEIIKPFNEPAAN